MNLFVIVAILIAIVTMVFSVQNAQPVKVSFLSWYFEGSQAFVLVLTFVAGFATAWLVSIPEKLKRRRELQEYRRKEPQGEQAREKGDGPESK